MDVEGQVERWEGWRVVQERQERMWRGRWKTFEGCSGRTETDVEGQVEGWRVVQEGQKWMWRGK